MLYCMPSCSRSKRRTAHILTELGLIFRAACMSGASALSEGGAQWLDALCLVSRSRQSAILAAFQFAAAEGACTLLFLVVQKQAERQLAAYFGGCSGGGRVHVLRRARGAQRVPAQRGAPAGGRAGGSRRAAGRRRRRGCAGAGGGGGALQGRRRERGGGCRLQESPGEVAVRNNHLHATGVLSW